jgi:hypothetical protein
VINQQQEAAAAAAARASNIFIWEPYLDTCEHRQRRLIVRPPLENKEEIIQPSITFIHTRLSPTKPTYLLLTQLLGKIRSKSLGCSLENPSW